MLKIKATFSGVILIGCFMIAFVAITMAGRDCQRRRKEERRRREDVKVEGENTEDNEDNPTAKKKYGIFR